MLQAVLQDKKVRYIISELQKRVQDKNIEEENLPEKVIYCEAKHDDIVLQANAQ